MPTFAPFGLRPYRMRGAGYNNQGMNTYRTVNNIPSNIFRGDPVVFKTGTVTIADGGTSPLLGVFWGAAWWDPTTGRRVDSKHIPSGTSTAGVIEGEARPMALVYDAPDATFLIQCDATVSAGDMNMNFSTSVSSVAGGGGSTLVGLSRAYLLKASRTSGVAQFRLVGIPDLPGNNIDSPNTIVEVLPIVHNFTTVSVLG